VSAGGTTRWPVELRFKRAEKLLEIAFDDGSHFRLPAEYLRVESPSAEVQGHGPGQKTLVHGRAHVGRAFGLCGSPHCCVVVVNIISASGTKPG